MHPAPALGPPDRNCILPATLKSKKVLFIHVQKDMMGENIICSITQEIFQKLPMAGNVLGTWARAVKKE